MTRHRLLHSLLMLSATAGLGAAVGCGSTTESNRLPVAAVSVEPAASSLGIGEALPLQAKVMDASGRLLTGREVFWVAQDSTVASVSDNGVVTGRRAGMTQIIATAEGVAGYAAVTVTRVAVASVSILPPSAQTVVGGTLQLQGVVLDASGNPLSGRTVLWSSSNEAVATVDARGEVRGIAVGTATITAQSEGKSGTAIVRVTGRPVSAVRVEPTTVALVPGGQQQLTATLLDDQGNTLTGRALTWSSSDPSVATVSPSGLVTAVSPGSAVITVSSEGKSATAAVTVTSPAVAQITISPAEAKLHVGETVQLTATAYDAAGNPLPGRSVTWTSDNPSVAVVSPTGLVLGVLRGTATIAASSEGVTGTAKVTVQK